MNYDNYYKNGGMTKEESVSAIALRIGAKKEAVAKFVEKHKIDTNKLNSDLKSGEVYFMDVITAIVGKPDNKYEKQIVKKYSIKMAMGGKTQGYDDREDERLGMEYGKMSGKDFDGSHNRREHSRRDDARFEERMAKGGELTYDDFMVGDFYSNSSEGGKFKFVGKDESGRLRFEDSKGINRIFSPKRMNKYADGGMMARGGKIDEKEKLSNISYQLINTTESFKKYNPDRMYNFLKDDLQNLQNAIEGGDFEEVNRFYSYWGQHLKSLETKTNQRMYNFLEDDLEKLLTAIEEGDTQEVIKFFSYWNRHLQSLKMADGGMMAKGGSVLKSGYYAYPSGDEGNELGVFNDKESMISFAVANKDKYGKLIFEGIDNDDILEVNKRDSQDVVTWVFSRIGMDRKEANKKIKMWFISNYPADEEEAKQIDESVTFDDIWFDLKDQRNIYDRLRNHYVVREVFEKIATIYGVEYDFVDKMYKRESYAKGGMMADGGKLEAGVYRIGKPIKVSPNLYAQKIAEIFDNGDIGTASDYGRSLGDFKSQMYPIITEEKLEAQYRYADGGMMAEAGEVGDKVKLLKGLKDENIFRNFPEGEYEIKKIIKGNDSFPEGFYEIENKDGRRTQLKKSRFALVSSNGFMADGGELEAKKRLEELREVLRSEDMSYSELLDLQSLAKYIDKDDVELLEAAGVPEFDDDEPSEEMQKLLEEHEKEAKKNRVKITNLGSNSGDDYIASKTTQRKDGSDFLTSEINEGEVTHYWEEYAQGGVMDDGGEIGQELMGGQPNQEKPSGAILLEVRKKGKEIVVTEDDGETKELYVKSNGFSGYTLHYKGNQYEFAHSLDSYDKGGQMADAGFVVVSENDGYWYIMSKPTSKQDAEEFLSTLTIPRGEVGKVVSVEDAKNHKKVIGRKYLKMADGGVMSDERDKDGMLYALQEHISSGEIANITNVLKYTDIDEIRTKAIQYYLENGDKPYSYAELKSVLKKFDHTKMADGSGVIIAYANGDDNLKLGEFASRLEAKNFAKENKNRFKTITFEDDYGYKFVVYKDDTFKDLDNVFSNPYAKGGMMDDGGMLYENWDMKNGEVTYNGKLVTRYDFDRDADAFFIDAVSGGGQKGFREKMDVYEYLSENVNLSKFAKGGKITRNKNKNDYNSMFNFFIENNYQPIGKRDLIEMAYASSNGVDSAIPQSMVGDVDNTAFYVYDYQTDKMGELVDLRMKLKFSNVKVDVTIVQNGELKYGRHLPYELENATFHQALNYVFTHDDVEQFNIRPRKKFELGGAIIEDQYVGRTAEDIWDSLSKLQRYHFIDDHALEIEMLKDENYDFNSDKFPESISNDLVKNSVRSDWKNLDEVIQNRFANHIRKGEYAKGGMMADGGAIENQYEGRTPEDIWNNLTKTQRTNFLFDHKKIIEIYRHQELSNLDIKDAVNTDWDGLDELLKNEFEYHTSRGQYAKGGMMADGGEIVTIDGKKYKVKTINRINQDGINEPYDTYVPLYYDKKEKKSLTIGRQTDIPNVYNVAYEDGKNIMYSKKNIDFFIEKGLWKKMAKGGKVSYREAGENYEYVNTFGIEQRDFEKIVDAYHKSPSSDQIDRIDSRMTFNEMRTKYGREKVDEVGNYIHKTHQSHGKMADGGMMADGGAIRSQKEFNNLVEEKRGVVKNLSPKEVAEMWNRNTIGSPNRMTEEEAKMSNAKIYLADLLVEKELTEAEYNQYFAKGGMMADGGAISEQNEMNKKVLALVQKANIDSKLEFGQLVVSALTDANAHSEVRKFISIIEKKPEWAEKPKEIDMNLPREEFKKQRAKTVYGSKYYDANEKINDLGIKIANMSGWEFETILDSLIFASEMSGRKDVAQVLEKLNTDDDIDYSKQTTDDFTLGEIVWDVDNERYGTVIGIYDDDGFASSKFELRLDSDGVQPTENLRKVGDKGDKGTKEQLDEAITQYARLVKLYGKDNDYPKQIKPDDSKDDDKPKNKWEYTDKDEIEYVVVKDKNGKELKFDGKYVISGVHDLLEKGGKLTEIGKYYSKNDVVSVFVNGKNILDKNTVSGVWIQKDAKPMAEDVADTKIGKTSVTKGVNGWKAKTMVDNFKGFDWDITTIKNSRGDLTTTAQGGKSEDKGGYKIFTFMLYQDPSIRLKSSRPARVNEKVVSEQHAEAMKDWKERQDEISEKVDQIQGKKKMADGGAIGFDALAKKVAKNYEGDKVKKEFQDEYGKTYDKTEAEEVGKKVAGKVYRQQQAKGKMAKGGKVDKKNGTPANRSQSKMTLISRKASEIRKANEPWRDAFNRAKAMLYS